MERDRAGVKRLNRRGNNLIKGLILFFIEVYRIFISPIMPAQCRYYPTCSCYMKEAIEKKGLWRGILLGVKRVLRCNPFYPGGYDPVK